MNLYRNSSQILSPALLQAQGDSRGPSTERLLGDQRTELSRNFRGCTKWIFGSQLTFYTMTTSLSTEY